MPEDDWYYEYRTMTVIEEEREPEPTGLFDQYGRELYRHPKRRPIGFDLRPRAGEPGKEHQMPKQTKRKPRKGY